MKRRALEFVAIFALAVALLGVLELAVRGWERVRLGHWPQTRAAAFYQELERGFSLYRRHAFLNMAPQEGRSVTAFGKTATFNGLGYRSPERPAAKPDGVTRVLLAGGSTTFDLLAENDAATWPWQLEAALRRRGCEVEIWNAGFPGWTSVENTISLMLRDLELEPDWVVLFQGINDLQPASLEPFDRHYEGHAEEARRAMAELPPRPWYGRSLLLEKLSPRTKNDLWQRIGPGDGHGERAQRLSDSAVRVFDSHIRSFIRLAGVRVALMTQTLRLRQAHAEQDRRYLAGWMPGLEPEAAPGQLERLNDVLRTAAQQQGGVDLIDAARDVEWTDADFADAMHFSAAGSRRLAGFLAPILLAQEGPCGPSVP